MTDVDVLPMVLRDQSFAQRVAAVTVTRHVAAHAHFRARRRLQKEMGIEARDGLQTEQRHAQALAERAQLALRQITVRPLNPAELVEDW